MSFGRRLGLMGILVNIWVFSLSCLAAGTGGSAPDSSSFDCGTLALSTLLAIEGRRVPLAELTRRLPSPRPDGYAMKELRDAGASLGLELKGVLLDRRDQAIDRPMIVYLRNQKRIGHYVCVRPAGHTGHLVQVIDSLDRPRVVDKSTLFDSPDWTSAALVPVSAPRRRWVYLGFGTLAVVIVGTLGIRRRTELQR